MTTALLLLMALGAAEVDNRNLPIPHCGIACLYGGLNDLHINASTSDIERRISDLYPNVDLSNLSLAQLRGTAESYGLYCASLRVEDADLGNMPPNAILYFRPERLGAKEGAPGHFVLLRGIANGRVRLLDLTRSDPNVDLSVSDLPKLWDGEFLMLSTNSISSVSRTAYVAAAVVGAAVLLLVALGHSRRPRFRMNLLVFGFVSGTISFVGCGHQDPISVDRSVVDAGVVQEGCEASGQFRFSVWNKGPVTIKAIERSCECLDMGEDISGVTLAAGSEHCFILGIPTRGHAGAVSGFARIKTDPPMDAEMVVTVNAMAVGTPSLVSSREVTIQVPYCQPVSRRPAVIQVAYLRTASAAPLQWAKANSNLDGLEVESVRIRTEPYAASGTQTANCVRDLAEIRLQVPKDLKCGTYARSIELAWNIEGARTHIPIAIHVEHPLRLLLEQVFIGDLHQGEHRSLEIPFAETSPLTNATIIVMSDSPAVHGRVISGNKSMLVDVDAGARLGQHKSCLILTGTGPGNVPFTPLQVPVSVLVQ